MNISDRPYQRIMRSLGLSPHMPHFGPCVCHAQPILEEEIEVLLWVAKTLSSDGDAEEMIESRSDRSRRSKPEKKIYESKWMARITGNFNLPWYKSSPCRRLISAIPIAELNIRGSSMASLRKATYVSKQPLVGILLQAKQIRTPSNLPMPPEQIWTRWARRARRPELKVWPRAHYALCMYSMGWHKPRVKYVQ